MNHRVPFLPALAAPAVVALLAALVALGACGSKRSTTPTTGVTAPTDSAEPEDTGPRTPLGRCKAGGAACADLLGGGLGASPCKLEGKLPEANSLKLEPWFTHVTHDLQAIDLVHVPDGTDRIAVVDRRGTIDVFANDRQTKARTRILDIKAKVSTAGEGGLLSVAFHPQFKTNRQLFVNYTRPSPFTTVVSRFTLDAATGRAPSSGEQVLLTIKQPWSNHDGGQIAFDATGKLLIGMGDGGSGGDPLNAGQDDKTMLGKMLRIDVDKPAGSKPYGIPADNPKLTMAHAAKWLPEVWAKGLRNPWRFAVDRVTGKVWTADVGQNKYEEVDIVQAGKNYGWRITEGTHCFLPQSGCKTEGLTPPVDEYDHKVGRSITGGYVYRGKDNPGLYGAYLYADYTTGRFFALRSVGGTYKRSQLLDTSYKPVGFGEDQQGEVYVTMLMGGPRVMKLVATKSDGGAATFPLTLKATGCFTDLAALTPAAGVMKFELNAPLWSDDADKQRYLVLPAGKGAGSKALKLPASDTDSWQVPTGTLVIKHFGLGHGAVGTAAQAPVETRFMKRTADGWQFYTYAWRADAEDADLVRDGASRVFDVPTSATTKDKQSWELPSIAECETCHTGPAGADLLGLQTAQLHRKRTFGSAALEQLEVMDGAGLLSGYKDTAGHARMPQLHGLAAPPADQATLTAAARAYLHVQCAACHRPGGNSNTGLDLRFATPLAAAKACGVKPQKGDLGVADIEVIAPGKPEKSALWLRMNAAPNADAFMPEIGVAKKHAPGVALIKAWIETFKTCP